MFIDLRERVLQFLNVIHTLFLIISIYFNLIIFRFPLKKFTLLFWFYIDTWTGLTGWMAAGRITTTSGNLNNIGDRIWALFGMRTEKFYRIFHGDSLDPIRFI